MSEWQTVVEAVVARLEHHVSTAESMEHIEVTLAVLAIIRDEIRNRGLEASP